jgi:hypothetical protein
MDRSLRDICPAIGKMGSLHTCSHHGRGRFQASNITQFSIAEVNRCGFSGPLGYSLSHSQARAIEADRKGHASQDGGVQSRTLVDDPDRGNLRCFDETVNPLLGTAFALAHHQDIVGFIDDDDPVVSIGVQS